MSDVRCQKFATANPSVGGSEVPPSRSYGVASSVERKVEALRGQISEVRRRKSEVSGQKPDVRHQMVSMKVSID